MISIPVFRYGQTRAHLPALVGTSREMTGRVLRRLESEGIIERIGRDRLRVLDADGLHEWPLPVQRRENGDRRKKFLVKASSAMRQ